MKGVFHIKVRNIRIIVDVFLLLLLIFSIRTWDSNLTVHIIGGSLFAFLLVVHVFFNKKWLISVSRTFKQGKLSKKVKWQYFIDLLLLAVWSIVILSGFLAIGYVIAEKEHLLIFSQIHGVSIRLGGILIIIHICQHRKQIGSYIKRKKV